MADFRTCVQLCLQTVISSEAFSKMESQMEKEKCFTKQVLSRQPQESSSSKHSTEGISEMGREMARAEWCGLTGRASKASGRMTSECTVG